ncbi:sin3 histone deacetylase corepressor complex component SDS3 isoform X1 [Paralichthys olivaceus]|nr:PREDICTED: sin3 histone deacetylase corepressor complex component SDS3 isoform X1 [Paralichthys olivaceus]
MLRGPASCRRCSQAELQKNTNRLFILCLFTFFPREEMASTLLSPMVDYYNDEEELDSVDDDDDRSFRGRDSEEDTEDASETDLAKHDEDDYVEIKEQMYQDKLASLKRQLQQLQEGTLQEYQKRMKKLDQQYKERLRNADLFLQLETEQVERNYIKEKKAAVKEFDDKKVELKENLIAELEEKKKMIENEKLTMELTGDSMEVKPIMTRKLRRRPNDPVPIPDKRRKPAPAQLNYLLTDEQIMEDLRTLNKLKSPKRPGMSTLISPSSPEHVPSAPMESPSQRYEARIEEGKLYYDKRWYHKSQAIYLESKDNTKISCVISSVGTNEIWVRKTSDSTKMRIYLGQLQRGAFVIRRRSAA